SREMLAPAVWHSTGTEMAYPLSSIRNRSGSRCKQATLSDSQNSPSLVAPSPAVTSVTSSLSLPRYNDASAQPTACVNCVPVGEEPLTMWISWLAQCEATCRPPDAGSLAEATPCGTISEGATPS